ncbi:Gfo/Idh/MocA family protein [Georgenia sp. MJ170]|uniref:Gfo/Idh/MocA family protein n=1 Tax=Georgenia sunbinii TaxID=3117728 RepID=UPI002F266A04
MPIRTALVGFGLAGRVFHAPLIAADDAYSLDVIVTGDPGRVADAQQRYPEARVVPSLEEALAQEVDLVVVATPPQTHVPTATAALEAGCAVVVDKPLSVDVASGRELVARAAELGQVLVPFQNRRWDSDFLTVRRLLDRGALGEVHRYESRIERWKTGQTKAWKAEATWREGGGVLFDLGAHLIDQALVLFGPAEVVHAEVSQYGGAADDDVFVSLEHDGGTQSHLWMSLVVGQPGPRLRVLGSQAAFTVAAGDVQEDQLGRGMLPTDSGYGRPAAEDDGVLGVVGDLARVPSEPGSYPTFYSLLATALRDDGPLPVDPSESLAVIEIIEEIHTALS